MSENDDYFDPDQFRKDLEMFIFEVWDNPSQAARAAGVDYADLNKTIQGKRKKLLKAWEVNALLNYARFRKELSEERYGYWYERLHKRLLSIRTLDAWLYDESDGRIRRRDKLRLKDNEEHNELLQKNLVKEMPYLHMMVDRIFKAGGMTWSVTTIYVVIRRSRKAKDFSDIILPNDWQIYLLDVADTVIRIDWTDLVTEGPEKIGYVIHHWRIIARKIITRAITKTLGGR